MAHRSKWTSNYATPKRIEHPTPASFEMNRLRLAGWGYGRLANHFEIPPWEVGMHIHAARRFIENRMIANIGFQKYIGRFEKEEAGWALQVLDIYDGSQTAAVKAIKASLKRTTARLPKVAKLRIFDRAIHACFVANKDWWAVGINHLAGLGIIELS